MAGEALHAWTLMHVAEATIIQLLSVVSMLSSGLFATWQS